MHHLATGFRLLRSPQSDICAAMSTEQRKQLRSAVIGMVLATDRCPAPPLATPRHPSPLPRRPSPTPSPPPPPTPQVLATDLTQNFTVISAYKTMLAPEVPEATNGEEPPPPGPPRTRKEERAERGERGEGAEKLFSAAAGTMTCEERLTVLKMAVKCADIGNVTKGKATALLWTERVVEEFFAQGDEERSLGLPVTPMLDRATANVAKQQLGFYNFIVRPMYDAMDLLVDMGQHLANLDEMHAHWSEQAAARPPDPRLPRPATPHALPPHTPWHPACRGLQSYVPRAATLCVRGGLPMHSCRALPSRCPRRSASMRAGPS